MIIDYKSDSRHAEQFSIFDAETGELLDGECIFYADDEAGFYHRHLTKNGHKYTVWDEATRSRIVAWDRVDRKIVIRPKEEP